MLSLSHRKTAFLFVLIAFIGGVAPALAERKYALGTSVDFLGGASNQLGQSSFNLSRLDEGAVPFYSFYPSADFKSEGQHSTLELNYAMTGDSFQMTDKLITVAHTFTGDFSAQLGKTTNLKLSDTFNNAPDFSTQNVLKGFILTPTGFQYIFEPELYKRSNISNSANLQLDFSLTPRTILTFTGAGANRFYNSDVVLTSIFPNQVRMEGDLALSHTTSTRQTWAVKYKIWQNDYEHTYIVRTHAATISLSRQLSPTVYLIMEGGPSFMEKSRALKSSVGYTAYAQVSKRVDKNLISLGYSHRSGDSTGLGTVSESHQGTLDFSRTFARNWSVSLQSSAFKQHSTASDAFNYWNASGSMSLSRQLGQHLVAAVGGSYMTYSSPLGAGNNTYRRVYASIGLRFPELWRGKK
jgi:hypothetical protein